VYKSQEGLVAKVSTYKFSLFKLVTTIGLRIGVWGPLYVESEISTTNIDTAEATMLSFLANRLSI